jgi:mannose-6-phosphate isomerase-like protein (cupin superfamily)
MTAADAPPTDVTQGDLQMLQAKEALAVGNGTGEARWWFGTLAEIKATATDTGGLCTIVEVTCAPNYEAALHVHHREDEGFWVLAGRVTFEVGATKFEAGAGDYAFGPRGLPHRFTAGDSGCRMLFILTPGGFEDLIRATSMPAGARTVPSHDGPPPDIERIKAIVATYGCELLA